MGIARDVAAEARDALIFDAVESEDCQPTDLTMGGLNSTAMRLLNVAVTRARRKLVLVANTRYLQSRLGPSHTLWQAIAAARSSAVVESRDLVSVQGEAITQGRQDGDPLGKRDSPGIVLLNGSTFYSKLNQDIATAQRDVTLVSPFVTESRVDQLNGILAEAVGRSIAVHALTRPAGVRADDIVQQPALDRLAEQGVRCTAIARLHAKAALIDDEIAYVGSLNILSFGGATHEFMLRIASPDLVRTLRRALADLAPRGAPQGSDLDDAL